MIKIDGGKVLMGGAADEWIEAVVNCETLYNVNKDMMSRVMSNLRLKNNCELSAIVMTVQMCKTVGLSQLQMWHGRTKMWHRADSTKMEYPSLDPQQCHRKGWKHRCMFHPCQQYLVAFNKFGTFLCHILVLPCHIWSWESLTVSQEHDLPNLSKNRYCWQGWNMQRCWQLFCCITSGPLL
jgi:hypothetical protein